jgi:uncharacterized protein (DUF169 family)
MGAKRQMNKKIENLCSALEEYCKLSTMPVAVKLGKESESPPTKAKRPLRDFGHRIAACQGMTIARTIGWTIVLRKEDHACPLAPVFLGHIAPDIFLEGAVAGYYQDQDECGKKMERSFPRWPVDSIRELWFCPLNRCDFEPDLAVVYGNPAQILTLIHAANFRHGPGVNSCSTGRGGCATWIAGVVQSGECTYMVPGSGERVFAGTQDHEMSFAIPYAKFENVVDGLGFIRKQGTFRYPVPNLAILSEPKFPEKYYTIDPGARTNPKE